MKMLDMMNESLRLAKKYDADYTLFPILVPIPGTDIRKICVDEHLIKKINLKILQICL